MAGARAEVSSREKRWMRPVERMIDAHPAVRLFVRKIGEDNIGMLAGFVSWSILTSMLPLAVGVVAISSLFLQSASARADLVSELSRIVQGAISAKDIDTAVKAVSHNTGLLGAIGLIGVFWGGSNIGGSFSTAFEVIFDAKRRPFVREKLIDVSMIFIFTGLMLLIVFSTSATALLDRFAADLPLPGFASTLLATGIGFFSALVLFGAIYSVFPNIAEGEKLRNVWQGALLSAVLFEIVTLVWPLYIRLSHVSRYGALLFALIVLTTWIYCFAFILMIGAEVIAVASSRGTDVVAERTAPVDQETPAAIGAGS